jgi:hypothetical protein
VNFGNLSSFYDVKAFYFKSRHLQYICICSSSSKIVEAISSLTPRGHARTHYGGNIMLHDCYIHKSVKVVLHSLSEYTPIYMFILSFETCSGEKIYVYLESRIM